VPEAELDEVLRNCRARCKERSGFPCIRLSSAAQAKAGGRSLDREGGVREEKQAPWSRDSDSPVLPSPQPELP